MMRIGVNPTGDSGCDGSACAHYDPFRVDWAENLLGNGLLLRHEIGHLVFYSMLDRSWDLGCSTHEWGGFSGRGFRSCEWGSYATEEGVPTLIALRSITTADTNTWLCGMNRSSTVGNQDACSECRFAPLSVDKMAACGSPAPVPDAFRGIGDTFATQKTDCARLDPLRCACPDITGGPMNTPDGVCDNYQSLGWRNLVQVVRFFWDILDTSTDGGRDNTDMTMSGAAGLAAMFESIPCIANTDYGKQHTCQECNRAVGGCTPVETDSSTPDPAAGTRDGFNLYDFSFFIPDGLDGQWDERDINCASGALD
jgi:hypothetical protein